MADEHLDENETPEEPEIPASVTFMEMMRHAASRSDKGNASPPAEAESDESRPPESLLPEDDRERKRRYAAALETQRLQRVSRRRKRRRRRTVSLMGGFLRSVMMVSVAAGLMATIFVWWTPTQFIASDVRSELGQGQGQPQPAAAPVLPTPRPTPNWMRKIGIVSGHRGPELDPGAVCPDGLTEAETTFDVAQRVVRALRGQGFSVDLLDEFDPRLDNYHAAALVSIHANTCQDFGEVVSGYLVAAAASRVTARGDDDILVDCIARYYHQATGLERHSGLTEDMTNYHTFREIHSLTPAAIIEIGFLRADRELLTAHPDRVAEGITNGILCFLTPSEAPPASADTGETASPTPGN